MSGKSGETERKRFVFPGEMLGVIEEFLPGQGTYVKNGNIYSSATGYLRLDKVNKEAQVDSKARKPIVPKKGDIVIGRVSVVQDKTMTIKIFQIGDKVLDNYFTGVMHVSNACKSYVKKLFDVFKVGDIVRSKVISTMNREFHLTTEGRDFGVLRSRCSKCGDKLVLRDRRLRCPSCNRSEKRKVASDYGE